MMMAAGLSALALCINTTQWYALLSVPIMALYNGQRGKCRMKYLFYLYYPLHLVVIYALGIILK